MKILYVFGGENASGGEIVIKRLIDYNRAFIESHLFISPGKYATKLRDERFKPLTEINELKKLNRGSNGTFKLIIKMAANSLSLSFKVQRYVRKQKIDVVHANTFGPAFYLIPAMLLSKLFNNKLLWIWSDHDLKYHTSLDTKLASICSKLYNKTLAVSKAVKAKYTTDKAIVLYNGLDTNQFQNNDLSRLSFRNKYSFTSEEIVVGLAGFIDDRKGQLGFVGAFKQLREKFNNISLVFAGRPIDSDGDYYKAVINEIKNLPYIKYIGQAENMNEFYCGCDVIVSNSSKRGSEPLGTTIYEAMACEKVVLASNTGGTPEIISDGVDGFLFEPDSTDDLRSKLQYIIQNFSRLEQIKQNARQKVIAKFNIVKMSSEYLKILQRN